MGIGMRIGMKIGRSEQDVVYVQVTSTMQSVKAQYRRMTFF